MGFMQGKRGLVTGIANDHSYAWYITQSLVREGAQCLDCKRGQDALVASEEGRLLNRARRAMRHVCYGACAGMYFCSECSGAEAPCGDCKFTQEHVPEMQ